MGANIGHPLPHPQFIPQNTYIPKPTISPKLQPKLQPQMTPQQIQQMIKAHQQAFGNQNI